MLRHLLFIVTIAFSGSLPGQTTPEGMVLIPGGPSLIGSNDHQWHSGGGCISVHRRNALPQHWLDMAGGFRCVKDVD